jgi:diphosphomevalonate decarboxylase
VSPPPNPPPGPPLPGRATATAPANIALVKYWGARDLARALPLNPSLSMTLSACHTRTTVDFSPAPGDDEVWLAPRELAGDETVVIGPTARAAAVAAADAAAAGGEAARGQQHPEAERRAWRDPGPAFTARVLAHLDVLRRRAGLDPGAGRFRVVTGNSFPSSAGIASSASGFAALTVAAAAALGLPLDLERDAGELSSLARQSGSGSATRSLLGGFVLWPDPAGGDADDPRAVQLHPADHWRLADLVALVDTGAKEVSSLGGHRLAPTSPYFARRLEGLPERLDRVRRALADRDFATLATAVEEEAIDLHLIAMSSRPPIFYWTAGTVDVLAAVRRLRAEGVPACATIDAGPNVHVLCPPEAADTVAARLAEVPAVLSVLRDRAGDGPVLEEAFRGEALAKSGEGW